MVAYICQKNPAKLKAGIWVGRIFLAGMGQHGHEFRAAGLKAVPTAHFSGAIKYSPGLFDFICARRDR